jgi:signal transduction histidine kinase
MEPGGRLRIKIDESEEIGTMVIRISDSGKGISENDLPKIFDPYFTTKSSGTGLGLPIAHNIVEAMGGGMEVSSRPGKGTTFRITIPNRMNHKKQISNNK